jgi:hypothetical protein
LRDRAPDLGCDLLVQLDGFVAVDLDAEQWC